MVSCITSLLAHAQQADTNLIEFENSYFYHITGKENSKLILYMHGGVSNPFFKQQQNDIEVGELHRARRKARVTCGDVDINFLEETDDFRLRTPFNLRAKVNGLTGPFLRQCLVLTTGTARKKGGIT